MKITIPLSLFLLLVATSSISAMMIIQKNDPATESTKRAQLLPKKREQWQNDVEQIDKSDDPVSLARIKINAADRDSEWSGITSYYVTVAAKHRKAQAFRTLLMAGASIADTYQQTLMDIVLESDFKDGIDTIVQEGRAKYDCHFTSLAICNTDTLLHFSSRMYTRLNNYPTELQLLSDAVVTHCDTDSLRAFTQEGFLRVPKYYKSNKEKSRHNLEICQKILNLYAENSEGLPAELHQKTKRFILEHLIDTQNNYNDHEGPVFLSMAKQYPYQFNPHNNDDLLLARKAYEFALRKCDEDLLEQLKTSRAPLPTDLTSYINFLLRLNYLDISPIISCIEWCIDNDTNPNRSYSIHENTPNEPQHPLITLMKTTNNQNYQKLLPFYLCIKEHYDSLSPDQIMTYLHTRTNAVGLASLLMETHPELINNPDIAYRFCQFGKTVLHAQRYSMHTDRDPAIQAEAAAIIDRACLHTPDGHYTARKKMASLKASMKQFNCTASHQDIDSETGE